MSVKTRPVTRTEAFLMCDRCKTEQNAQRLPRMQSLTVTRKVTDRALMVRNVNAKLHICPTCIAQVFP